VDIFACMGMLMIFARKLQAMMAVGLLREMGRFSVIYSGG
jgi:hypothetical protein